MFLDRDGTICEEVGYLNHLSRLHIFPFAAAAIRRLNEAGLPVIVVTNQSGISRRIFPESLVAQVHARMSDELSAAGARVDAYYYCTHTRAGRLRLPQAIARIVGTGGAGARARSSIAPSLWEIATRMWSWRTAWADAECWC